MARPTNADPRATRRRLLDAATVAFSSGGLEGTTLRAVAKEAGVTMPTIHHYFGNKQGLFDACRQEAVLRLSTDLAPVGALMATARDAVLAGEGSDLAELVERLVRDGSRAARSHRMALQLVWRPLVDEGGLDATWTATVLTPFLDQVTAGLGALLDRPSTTLRLDIQGIVALILRYALSTPEHLAELAGLPAPATDADRARTVATLEDHLVRLARRVLEIPYA